MRIQLAVSEFARCQVVEPHLRRDRGRARTAILSSCTSSAKRGCGVPWPRFGPHGALFVKKRAPRKW
jgi:hypothetical protein